MERKRREEAEAARGQSYILLLRVTCIPPGQWFTRGWTLQELLAPKIVEFYSRDCVQIGDKISLEEEIHEMTGIAVEALRGAPLFQFRIVEKLQWRGTRQITEAEDKAYCLLGIFDVYLPPIYGEGEMNAMRRLLREIKESSNSDFSVSGANTPTSTQL